MKTVLLFAILILPGCCSTLAEVRQDNKELLISLDNRYKQLDILLTNRHKEFRERQVKVPGWLKLQMATLPSYAAEVSKYKKKQFDRSEK